jgi:hypothetical protein
MSQYVAVSLLYLGSEVFEPGQALPGLAPETAEWLLAAGAISATNNPGDAEITVAGTEVSVDAGDGAARETSDSDSGAAPVARIKRSKK